jgi:hypothetical protein
VIVVRIVPHGFYLDDWLYYPGGCGHDEQRAFSVPRFIWLSRLPDHMPHHPGDPGKLQAYAFGYGYINGLINAANSEVS